LLFQKKILIRRREQMAQIDSRKTEQGIRYIAGGLIIIIGIAETLRIVGVEPALGFDILKALLLLGTGLFVTFHKASE
jgi:hypothetical protein